MLRDPEALAKTHFTLLIDVLVEFTFATYVCLLLLIIFFHVAVESLGEAKHHSEDAAQLIKEVVCGQ